MRNNFGGLDLATQQQERFRGALDALQEAAGEAGDITLDDGYVQDRLKEAIRAVMAERKRMKQVERNMG